MASDYIVELTKLYETYEEKRTQAKAFQDEAKDYKNLMVEIMNDNGVTSAIVAGLDADTVELSISNVERILIDRKSIAEQLGIKPSELSKIETWVNLTKQGKITPEMIEAAKFPEVREQFSARAVDLSAEDE